MVARVLCPLLSNENLGWGRLWVEHTACPARLKTGPYVRRAALPLFIGLLRLLRRRLGLCLAIEFFPGALLGRPRLGRLLLRRRGSLGLLLGRCGLWLGLDCWLGRRWCRRGLW